MKKRILIFIGLVIVIIFTFLITLRFFNNNNYELTKKVRITKKYHIDIIKI